LQGGNLADEYRFRVRWVSYFQKLNKLKILLMVGGIIILEIYKREHELMKDDLFHLKDCQIKFIAFAVTATGFLLSILANGKSSEAFYLIPLIILLPGWCVFFDKAVTLARMLGYYTILEGLIVGRYESKNFKGWERALGEYRENSEKKLMASKSSWKTISIREKIGFFFEVVLLRRNIKPNYWHLIYSIFFWLSWLCIGLSISSISTFLGQNIMSKLSILIIGFLTLIFSVSNLRTLHELEKGKYSCKSNNIAWKKILDVVKTKSAR
jgi:hypothetical protein